MGVARIELALAELWVRCIHQIARPPVGLLGVEPSSHRYKQWALTDRRQSRILNLIQLVYVLLRDKDDYTILCRYLYSFSKRDSFKNFVAILYERFCVDWFHLFLIDYLNYIWCGRFLSPLTLNLPKGVTAVVMGDDSNTITLVVVLVKWFPVFPTILVDCPHTKDGNKH